MQVLTLDSNLIIFYEDQKEKKSLQRYYFAAKERQTGVILQQDIDFRNFFENENTMVLF